MKMVDYESGRNLRDIDIELTRTEAEQLAASLGKLLGRQDLKKVFLTDFSEGLLDKELTVSLKLAGEANDPFTTG